MKASIFIWTLIGISFGIYFLISLLYKTLKIHNLYHALLKQKGLGLINLKHLIGIGVFGIMFFVACPDLRYLLTDIDEPKMNVFFLFLLVILLCVKISIKSAKKVQDGGFNIIKHSYLAIVIYFTIRVIFLLFYEFFFRGILFYSFLKFNTLSVSILYTIILYVIIHAFDSKKEIVGAIPFGIVLCLFTYYTNNVWAAFIIHAALSLAFEISLINTLILKPQKL